MLTGLEHSVEDRLLRKTYGEQNITWKRVIRSDSIDTVMKMVKSGSGIAIGPQSFAEYYGVTAVPLVPARQDSLYFACLKSKKKEPEIREFQRYSDYSGFQCLSRLNPRPWTSCTWETMIKLSGSIRWTFFSSWTSSRLDMTVSTIFSCWFR